MKATVLLILFFFFPLFHLEPCTGFKLQANDGSLFYGRSLEFAINLESEVEIVPKKMSFVGNVNNKQGLKWETKYGFVGINGYAQDDLILDGINEKGLVAAILLFPEAIYQKIPKEKQAHAIGCLQVVTWILSNFSTTDEVKKAIQKIYVGAESVPVGPLKGAILGNHYVVHDKQGNCLVIEYINGILHLYDNPLGVLTNFPSFDWQMTNLRNYVNLHPLNSTEINFEKIKILPTGQGSGLLGLPADITPPSRFVKAIFLTQTALGIKNAQECLAAITRVLNVFSIVKGYSREVQKDKVNYDFSQWEVIADLQDLNYYFRTYANMNLRLIKLKEIDFHAKNIKYISMNQKESYQNVTSMMQ